LLQLSSSYFDSTRTGQPHPLELFQLPFDHIDPQ
jgi:hypothetical protein